MIQDLFTSIRTLFRTPGFALAGILVLALAIGGNTAIFSIIDAVLLRPLEYPQADKLVLLEESNHQQHLERFKFAPADFVEIRDHNESFNGVASYNFGSVTLSGGQDPERLKGAEVSSDFFHVLGVTPIMGRGFLPNDDMPGPDSKVAVLSYGLWQRRFSGDTGILGQSIILDGENYSVIGVLPQWARFGGLDSQGAEIWVPAAYGEKYLSSHGHEIGVIGRLRADTTLAAARAEMETFSRRIADRDPASSAGWTIEISGLQDRMVEEIRPSLLVLLAAVIFVLLIAIVNMANLLAARAFLRNRDVAVRLSLGAPKKRILRQFLTESMTVSLAGGICGVVLAYLGVPALLRFTNFSLPGQGQVVVDWRVLGFALLLSLGTGFLFGIVPALFALRSRIMDSLREGASVNATSRTSRKWQRLLLLSEMTFTVVLLIGAGTSIQSFYHILRTDSGFDANGVLSMRISLPDRKYPSGVQRVAFVDGLLDRIRTLPGVRYAGVSHTFPLTHDMTFSFTAEGSAPTGAQNAPNASVFNVTPGYFQTMGIALVRGRDFNNNDRQGAVRVAIINETLARQYFPGQDPIGLRLKEGGFQSQNPWMTIVGVARDVKQHGLTEPVAPQLYESFYQRPFGFMTLAVRTETSPMSSARSVQQQVYLQDPEQPVYEVQTMEQLLAASLSRWKVSMSLLSIFALMSLVLAATGLYGVLTYSISQRTRELGLRAALGSSRKALLKLVLGETMVLSGSGVAVGVLLSLVLMRSLSAALFTVKQTSFWILLVAGLVLLIVAFFAGLVPASRAASTDPTKALRAD